ncbi:hypothetical protein JI739_15510 [Ramlibacter sp. AW1]|uniref:Uncharacterized protein n=1 Tax=Ramlibacter aurantiacus TaxID=2801330 RepID=A0A936ZL07_9BURK|nr:hypothetical protein [Ramlibacter aurantiacus]MBL0421757.1 hypothetical protein [Ramlibacter aurantiacus]
MRLTRSRKQAHPQGSRTQPRAGLMQCDHEGQVWLCEAVIRNGEIKDWYLVRLSRLDGSDPVGDPVVLSPSEYERFSISRHLEPVLL